MLRSARQGRTSLKTVVATTALAGIAVLAPADAVAAPSAPAVADTSRGANDHVLYWNNAILDVFRKTGGTPGPLTRGGAIMDLAIYDAVNSIQTIGKPYLTKDTTAAGVYGALNTSIDYAAYTSLRGPSPTTRSPTSTRSSRRRSPCPTAPPRRRASAGGSSVPRPRTPCSPTV